MNKLKHYTLFYYEHILVNLTLIFFLLLLLRVVSKIVQVISSLFKSSASMCRIANELSYSSFIVDLRRDFIQLNQFCGVC